MLLLKVKIVFSEVEAAFQKRELQRKRLEYQVEEKEAEIKCCEDQTKQQSEINSTLAASNSYHQKNLDTLIGELGSFKIDVVTRLCGVFNDDQVKVSDVEQMIRNFDSDLSCILLASKTHTSAITTLEEELISLELEGIENTNIASELISKIATIDQDILHCNELHENVKTENKTIAEEITNSRENLSIVADEKYKLQQDIIVIKSNVDDELIKYQEILMKQQTSLDEMNNEVVSNELMEEKLQLSLVQVATDLMQLKSNHSNILTVIENKKLQIGKIYYLLINILNIDTYFMF